MHPSGRNDRITFTLVLVTTLLGGFLAAWLMTGSSQQASLGSQNQVKLKLFFLSRERQQSSQVD